MQKPKACHAGAVSTGAAVATSSPADTQLTQQPFESQHALSGQNSSQVATNRTLSSGSNLQPASEQMPKRAVSTAERTHPARPAAPHTHTTDSTSSQPVIDLVHDRPVSAQQSCPPAASAAAEQPLQGSHNHKGIAQQSGLLGPEQFSLLAAESGSLPEAGPSNQPVQTQQRGHQALAQQGSHQSMAFGQADVQQTLQPQSASAKIASLTQQIKQLKAKMIHYASYLDSPDWKQQQPDRGKAVSCTTTCAPAGIAAPKPVLCVFVFSLPPVVLLLAPARHMLTQIIPTVKLLCSY